MKIYLQTVWAFFVFSFFWALGGYILHIPQTNNIFENVVGSGLLIFSYHWLMRALTDIYSEEGNKND